MDISKQYILIIITNILNTKETPSLCLLSFHQTEANGEPILIY